MRNARQNKIREYRKAIRGAKGTICLWKLFDKLHPNFFPKGRRWWFGGTVWWHAYRKAQREWMRNLTQEPAGQFHGMGNASASFRRDLNRLHRAKEK